MKRSVRRIFLVILVVGITYLTYFAWHRLPIISAYGAKNLCSCVMVAGRNPEDVKREELGWGPIALGTFDVNFQDSSTTGSVFGLAKRKAIYRKKLGCSVLVGMSEDEFREQKIGRISIPAYSQDTLAWPIGDLDATAPVPDSIKAKLNIVLDSAFAEPSKRPQRRTRAVIIIRDGKIVAERYAEGFNATTILTGWSMAKTVTNALVGILVKEKKLNINEPAPIPEWSNDDRKNITVNDLLHANTGLEWVEDYGNPSGATIMLYENKDMGKYAAQSKQKFKIGEKFLYSSGTTNIISRIIREKVGEENYHNFPYEKLFYKIGMLHATFETDAGGTFVGSSYILATARDWARFGLLYLNDGVWNGERILPEGWVKYSTTPASGAPLGEYGAQMRVNAGAPGDAKKRMFPDVPTDAFWADGFEGQSVFVVPSENLVVVKLSLTHGSDLDENKFLSEIISALH
jgi:CubicO group peptidase (beta-lactamase class C family)